MAMLLVWSVIVCLCFLDFISSFWMLYFYIAGYDQAEVLPLVYNVSLLKSQ